MGMFYLYLIFLAVISLPCLVYRGRCTENLVTISWLLRHPGCWLFGIKSEVINWGNMVLDKPCVIVSNHQSSLDVFGMAEMYPPGASFMAKKSLLYLGPLGLALWLSGGVFIDRAKHKSAQAVIDHTAAEMHERQLKLWIFPEGTRCRGRGMLPFKKGAFNLAVTAQVPVVPVVFKCYDDFYCKREHKFQPGKYIAEVMPPVSTQGLSLDDVPELAEKVRDQMLTTYKRLSGFDDNMMNNNEISKKIN